MWAAPIDQTNAEFPKWNEYGKLVYGDQENLVQAAATFDIIGTTEEPVYPEEPEEAEARIALLKARI